MSILEDIDKAGQRAPLPKTEKVASANDDEALKLADLMDKIASINEGGENQDVGTQGILSEILDDGQSGERAATIHGIRNMLQAKGVV